MQCRVEDLEKQTYRSNQIQARMEEVEAKLEALTLEKRRLESENCVLKTQVGSQQRVRAAQLNLHIVGLITQPQMRESEEGGGGGG